MRVKVYRTFPSARSEKAFRSCIITDQRNHDTSFPKLILHCLEVGFVWKFNAGNRICISEADQQEGSKPFAGASYSFSGWTNMIGPSLVI